MEHFSDEETECLFIPVADWTTPNSKLGQHRYRLDTLWIRRALTEPYWSSLKSLGPWASWKTHNRATLVQAACKTIWLLLCFLRSLIFWGHQPHTLALYSNTIDLLLCMKLLIETHRLDFLFYLNFLWNSLLRLHTFLMKLTDFCVALFYSWFKRGHRIGGGISW